MPADNDNPYDKMRRRLPPLNAIKAFEAVARHEHLGRAAEELCVSHSALSQQVKHLEEWFGLNLFERRKGSLNLTPEGAKLLPPFSAALDTLEEASQELTCQLATDKLVIQCEPTFASRCLRGKLHQLRKALGDIDIELITNQHLPNEFPKKIDVLIHYQHLSSWKDIKTTRLMDLYGFPACSPDTLSKVPAIKTPDDLQHFHLLHGEDRGSWVSWLKKHQVESVQGEKGTLYEDFGLAIEAAVAGEGAIIADPVFCHDELAEGKLVPLFDSTVHCANYHIICRKSNYQRPLIRRLYDWIIEEVKPLHTMPGNTQK